MRDEGSLFLTDAPTEGRLSLRERVEAGCCVRSADAGGSRALECCGGQFMTCRLSPAGPFLFSFCGVMDEKAD